MTFYGQCADLRRNFFREEPGKSDLIEFKKVRAEPSNAKQELAKLIPDLGAEIISLADARQRREVATFDLMFSSELSAEIGRLKPFPEKELVRLLKNLLLIGYVQSRLLLLPKCVR